VPEANAIEWDDAMFNAALERAAEGVIDARGVRLSSDQLGRLLDAAPKDPQYPARRLLRHADFVRATFSGDADFYGASFGGVAGFGGATFSGDADFNGASFKGADFDRAIFSGVAGFYGASFSGAADFDGATFSGYAGFVGATFSRNADFLGATFSGNAGFLGATFSGNAGFLGASFSGYADFAAASFSGDAGYATVSFSGGAGFGGATFSGDAEFRGATFEQTRQFGPVLAFGQLTLDGVVFARRVRIEVSARRASLARAVFPAGADLFVRWAEVSLEDADFAEPSLVAELPTTPGPGGERSPLGREEPVAGGGWVCRLGAPPAAFTPQVVSARRTKVARLTLSGVDLRACRFAGAHGLDGLRLERARFAQPPSGWRLQWRRPRWTRRQTVAEEHHWRVQHVHGPGWYERAVRAPDWLGQASEPLEPEQIAGIYRALRKGREDNKDAPGAADFYYGEMEMRRHSAPLGERCVVWLYWLVSGYGLRASRALIALAVTIAVGAVLLDLFGFEPDRSYGRALLFALESSISLLRAPEAKLTAGGEVVQIALRLAGPLFFGLALLSLRGRVKR
jgi:uncharacterized protein YjbI with pentapeptide repeats